MGKIKQGILGGFSGKVANVIGGSWKGIAYMRAMPLSVANPRTTAQVTQRGKLSAIVLFVAGCLSIIKSLNDRWAVKMSGYNLFVQRNIANFDEFGVYLWSALKISIGRLSASINTCTISAFANSVVVSFPTTLVDSFDKTTDRSYILVVDNVTKEVLGYNDDISARSTGTASLVLAAGTFVMGHTYHVYFGFKALDGTEVSDSAYSLEVATF